MNTKSTTRIKLSATDRRNLQTLLLVSVMEPMSIGRRISQARKEAGAMTQEELADLLGVTTRSVQGYEAGDVVPWKHFQRLEAIFSRSLGWFLHGDLPESNPNELLGTRLESLEAKVAESIGLTREALELLHASLPQEAATSQPRKKGTA